MADQKHTHTHTAKCYKTSLTCTKIVHTHSGSACYYTRGDKVGQLKCSTPEHQHSGGSPCYSAAGPLCGYV